MLGRQNRSCGVLRVIGELQRASEEGEKERHNVREREWRIKMAHNLAPSVNCSLDDIDLNALKVRIDSRIIRRAFSAFSPFLSSHRANKSRGVDRARLATAAAVFRTRLLSRACLVVPLVINLARTDGDDDEKEEEKEEEKERRRN